MSYLLYLDALGMQEHYNKSYKDANNIIQRIDESARTAFASHLPGRGESLDQLGGSSITIMNDSVFVHANELCHLIYIAAKFTKMMFSPSRNQVPVAFRGSIARTENSPILEHHRNGTLSFSKLVVDNISAAMIADKKRVIGARILVPKNLVDFDVMRQWHMRYQSLVMDVNATIKSTPTEVLKGGYQDFYDVAWMISEDEAAMQRIKRNLYNYWLGAIYSERASLHASATMLLFEACRNKRNGVENVLRVLVSGLNKAGKIQVDSPKKLKYNQLLDMERAIRRERGNALFIPPHALNVDEVAADLANDVTKKGS